MHPKNSCDELMHPELKIWNEVKSHFKINMQKDNCTTVCTKSNARQSTLQIQEIILNHFFAVAYYQPTFYTEIFFNCCPHQWSVLLDSFAGNAFFSGVGGLRFESRAGQIAATFLRRKLCCPCAMTRRWAPPTRYTLLRNAASVMKELILIWDLILHK